MKNIVFILSFGIFPWLVNAQQSSRISEEEKEILTYPFSDPNPVAPLPKKHKIYPYYSFEGYSPRGVQRKWKVVKLENDYIEVYILPEAGGKVWGAIEKSTGKEFIYKNEVMKFRNIALRGPWTSGGIEFNFGVVGHTPSTATPVDYVLKKNEDGSASCFVGNMDLPSRTHWRVEIRLPKDKAYFETRASWTNPTASKQSYYCWMTAAAEVSDDLEFFYPGNLQLGHDGRAYPWPIDEEGHDLSKYPNNAFGSHKSLHTVGEYNDFMGGYYHDAKFGFGHWARYEDMPGRKLWLWALSRNGGIWEDLLTDTDGQYMEFQAGRTFNQYMPETVKTSVTQVSFPPYSTDQWKEIWFPYKEIGGMKEVSPKGVLNVTQKGATLEIGINALDFSDAKLEVRSRGKVIHVAEKKFKPMDVYLTTVTLDNDSLFEVEVKGMDLKYSSEKKSLLQRPFVSFAANESESVEDLYLKGVELKEYRNYSLAKTSFKKCLEKDPHHIGATLGVGELFFRSAQYDSALYYAKLALSRDTYFPEANYLAGNIYKELGDTINALESFGWAARSMEYRSAAYTQMCLIKLMQREYAMAENYAQQALDYNRYNLNALRALAVVYRKTQQLSLANKIIEFIQSLDPLIHFANYEKYLLDPSSESYARFNDLIKNEFPYQTFLELCMDYRSMGMKEEAMAILSKAPEHPLVNIWKAYLRQDASALTSVTTASADFVFPFRQETISALEWATSKNAHWKFKYYLALNYWSIQREADAIRLFQACGDEPDYAPFYLTRVQILEAHNKEPLKDIEKAQRLTPEEWRTWSYLIAYYENIKEYKKALQISENAYKKFSSNYTIGVQYARSLLNNEQYDACIRTLEKINILPFEGSTEGKVIYEQALLLNALELIDRKKYKTALDQIQKSLRWPENLGVGEPYDADTRIQNYLTAYCLKKLNQHQRVPSLNKSIVDFSFKNPEPSFNHYLALLILKEDKEMDKANALIEKIRAADSDNNINSWVEAAFNNDTLKLQKLEDNFSGNKYFEIVKKASGL